MPFLVQLTDDAARDLEEICDYIEQHDAPGKADHVLEQIEQAFSSLGQASPPRKLPEGIAGHRHSGIP